MNAAVRAEQLLYAKLLKERYGPLDRLEAERFPREAASGDRARGASEEQWRRQVREIATRYGWQLQYHTADSRRSDAGWPDEVFGHADQRRTLFVEFKTDSGRIRPAQRVWLTHLSDSGFEVALWRPCDLHTVLRVLGPARQRAVLPPNFRRPA
ncbi:VRR-NUC domain-containing protein [Streptomyces sp. TRM66268-LWL]|uniref:VRR-NUC domain-containing protein n=1 Tax=Streptomyces polyasparticus TaxID=2767826 RepID=A0ABR7ST74_9ACTN|nr:VRR-NUC domain-containing protein [Streptomyces polyasparticus]MBC9717865.1 VRR-NUC domain-containing protein [Streptomyces polyasparticus]